MIALQLGRKIETENRVIAMNIMWTWGEDCKQAKTDAAVHRRGPNNGCRVNRERQPAPRSRRQSKRTDSRRVQRTELGLTPAGQP